MRKFADNASAVLCGVALVAACILTSGAALGAMGAVAWAVFTSMRGLWGW